MSGKSFIKKETKQLQSAIDNILLAVDGMDAETAHRAVFIARQFLPVQEWEDEEEYNAAVAA